MDLIIRLFFLKNDSTTIDQENACYKEESRNLYNAMLE